MQAKVLGRKLIPACRAAQPPHTLTSLHTPSCFPIFITVVVALLSCCAANAVPVLRLCAQQQRYIGRLEALVLQQHRALQQLSRGAATASSQRLGQHQGQQGQQGRQQQCQQQQNCSRDATPRLPAPPQRQSARSPGADALRQQQQQGRRSLHPELPRIGVAASPRQLPSAERRNHASISQEFLRSFETLQHHLSDAGMPDQALHSDDRQGDGYADDSEFGRGSAAREEDGQGEWAGEFPASARQGLEEDVLYMQHSLQVRKGWRGGVG